jgi:hypothetical protein
LLLKQCLRPYSADNCAGAATDAAAKQGMMMMVEGVVRRAVSCQSRMTATGDSPACRRQHGDDEDEKAVMV